MKPGLVILCHLPPPVHGASTVGKQVADSRKLRALFDCVVIPIRMTSGVASLKRFAFTKLLAAVGIYIRLLMTLLTGRIEAVYLTPTIDGYGLLRDCLAALIARLFGARLILHLHMKGVDANFRRSAAYRLMYRALFTNADVIHLSQNLYGDVALLVKPERFHVVANGIADPLAGAGAEPPARIRHPGPPTVLFLSNLDIEKGPLDLLEASARLAGKGIDHRIVFAGAEVQAEVPFAIAAAASGRGQGMLTLIGPVYGEAKSELMREADIFAFPSYYRYECQPLSLLEAMAHALPIVASTEGAIPDMLEDGRSGLLFTPRDIDALTDALRRLIADPALRLRLGEEARACYLETYTAEGFEERLVSTMSLIVGLRRYD